MINIGRNGQGLKMHPLMQDRASASVDQPGLLAPDTTGMNFYRADPALTDLLRLHLPEATFRHIEPHLDRLGAMTGGHLDECARLADRHTPVLHQREKFGRDTQWIEYHPAYRELERAAFGEFGIHAMSVRKGILGWPDKYPVVAKHAFTFLFNQAEFGLGCPINVTDGCAKLLNNFGSEALKAKYLDGLTQTDMSKLTQGGQFMTEKEGGSDVGTLTTTAVQEGDHWRLYGEKWFCSNADARVVMPLARRQLMKIMLPTEQALSMSFLTADALDRAEAGSQDAAALLRILTPTLKFRATRDARKVCGDALEMRGGIGYIEEFATARLLRDAHLGSIWEGTGNIVAIDALKRAVGRHGADNALAADLHARLDDSANVPQAWRSRLHDLTDRAVGFAREVAGRMDNEGDARRATSLLYHVASAVALAWEGGRIHEMRGDARRLLLSRMVVDHRVSVSDPFQLTENATQRTITDHLLGERAVGMAEVGELLSAA